MYESFFRFRFRPFAVLPDPDCILWTEGHRNALSVMEVGLDRLSQLTVLTGGIGTGKTTLVRRLLQTTSGAFSVGLLSNFAGARGDLLSWVLSAFGLNHSGTSEAMLCRRLARHLAGQAERGRRSVLIIDEAQNLSEPDLESLRLLSNLNAEDVLMMLVLVGQPQLRAKMASGENKRLCQRIGADYHLDPLTREETSAYIGHRCLIAGGSADLFEPAARDEIHSISAGVPRKINVLCDLALISAYAAGATRIDVEVVQSVVENARRHGTYTSLTEHDIVAVEEKRIVVAQGKDQMAASATDEPLRDPLQRLSMALEAGTGGLGRPAPAPASAPTSPPHPAPAAQSATSAPGHAGDLNALFGFTWSDDALLFVDDPAEEKLSPPAPARLVRPFRGAHRPGVPRPLPGGASGGAEAPGASRHATATGLAPALPDPVSVAAGSAATTAPAPLRQGAAASKTAARTARGTEAALRRAFAPQGGWHRTGWRGAAAVAALVASGSMAAGIAIALLPGDTPRNDPRSEVTEIRAEADGMDADPVAQAPRSAAARLADPAPRRDAASPSAAETDKPTETAPPGPAEALRAGPGAMAEPPQDGLSGGTEAEATFRHALDLAIDDSRAAVIAYARAAMLGHERAAYYLGQIYETGDGVPVDLAIARHWYEVSSAGNARARNRLAELPQPERSGDVAAPLPLFAEPSGAGQADFVWTSGQGADPASYVVELGTDARDGAVAAYPVTGSAARLPLAAEAGYWRVVALDVSGSRRIASDWQELAPAAPDRAAAEPESTSHL